MASHWARLLAPDKADGKPGFVQKQLTIYATSPCCDSILRSNGDFKWVCPECQVTWTHPNREILSAFEMHGHMNLPLNIIHWVSIWRGEDPDNVEVSVRW